LPEAEELRARLRASGVPSPLIHPGIFEIGGMNEGAVLTRGQPESGALNRYYYQSRIPITDGFIL